MNHRKYSAIIKIFIATVASLVIMVTCFVAGRYLSLGVDANTPNFITAISTVAIAFLTLAYVLTTSRQLATMQMQLSEMRRNTQLLYQPLPVVTPGQFSLEKPRAFYSPPEKLYTGNSRYHVRCRVENLGSSPAVSIHVCGCLAVPLKKNDSVFHSTAEYIYVLPVRSKPKVLGSFAPSFMFHEDHDGQVVDGLRSRHPDYLPVLKVCTVYKNLLGASFGCRQAFQVFPKSPDQENLLKNWHSAISTFASTFKHEIDKMRRTIDKNQDEWGDLFDQIKVEYSSKVEGVDQDMVCRQLPGAFKTQAISEEQYQKMVSGSHYGRPMLSQDHCLLEDMT